MKKLYIIIFGLIPNLIFAQLTISYGGNILFGDSTLLSTETGSTNMYIGPQYPGFLIGDTNNYFQMYFHGNSMYVSGSSNRVALVEDGTNEANMYCEDGYIGFNLLDTRPVASNAKGYKSSIKQSSAASSFASVISSLQRLEGKIVGQKSRLDNILPDENLHGEISVMPGSCNKDICITCKFPEDNAGQDMFVLISNMENEPVKTLHATVHGKNIGSVIPAGSLSPGLYNCTMIAGGKFIQSVPMVITNE